VAGSRLFARRIIEGDFDGALAIARRQVDAGAQAIDVNMDEALLDSEAAMTRFSTGGFRAGDRPRPGRRGFVAVVRRRSGLRCIGGKRS